MSIGYFTGRTSVNDYGKNNRKKLINEFDEVDFEVCLFRRDNSSIFRLRRYGHFTINDRMGLLKDILPQITF